MRSTQRIPGLPVSIAVITFLMPGIIWAGSCSYGEGGYYGEANYYAQSYYQAYYQPYYQAYYQGAYGGVNFTKDVLVTGDLSVNGSVSKGAGTFMIDHPLDPKNKLLYHSFVESPDAKNIYDGIATLNERGEARITLPRYFLALNKDYRYLATAISEPMPQLHLKSEVWRAWLFGEPSFVVAGGVPGGQISWQVSGIRRDRFIELNPIIPEVMKGPDEIVAPGRCIFEPLCE